MLLFRGRFRIVHVISIFVLIRLTVTQFVRQPLQRRFGITERKHKRVVVENVKRHKTQEKKVVAESAKYKPQKRKVAIEDEFDMLRAPKIKSWGVVGTKHVLSISTAIAAALRDVPGFTVTFYDQMPPSFNDDMYIVLCAQMFERLPPANKRIIYQLEQRSSGDRWFGMRSYMDALQSSRAVLEFSRLNLNFLQQKLGNKVTYLPAYSRPYSGAQTMNVISKPVPRDIDILFYGDHLSCPRRLRMINSLREAFNSTLNIQIITEVFGTEMRQLIERAKCILNIHYYEQKSSLDPCELLIYEVSCRTAVNNDLVLIFY